MKYKILFLDFDGVILDSNSLKDHAFHEIFKNYPQHFENIWSFHIAHDALTRGEKFHHVLKNIFNLDESSIQYKNLLSDWMSRFQAQTRADLQNAPLTFGTLDFLEDFHSRIEMYIVSATPEDELRWIVEKHGLTKYFKQVLGAPIKKIDHFKRILHEKKLAPEMTLFVGDALSDYDSSMKANIPFIGYLGRSQFENIDCRKINSLVELDRVLI